MIERISRFLIDPASSSFEELALAAFAYQFERIAPYRRMCERRGVTPASVRDWQEVPLVPAAAFKPAPGAAGAGLDVPDAAGGRSGAPVVTGAWQHELDLAAAPAVEVFRSSGTSLGEEARSVHRHPFPDLYRQTIDLAFPRFCLPLGGRPPMLSLIPTRAQLPDSSLSFMIDHVLARFGAPESLTAFGPRGVEAAPARSWAAARQREGRPVLVLATAFALAQWLESLERLGLRFRLPAGSAVFETGGFKGRATELTAEDLQAALLERLAIAPTAVVREYGMTELTSQCYTGALLGADPEVFMAPHWLRVRVLDPATLSEVPAGTPGLLALFDLANLGSAVHVLTEDLGVATPGGFRLLGRAAGADLRGCSLVVEELRA